MIKEEELREAIAECQGERNPNANTCIKLAAYYSILDHLDTKQPMMYSYAEPAEIVRLDSGSVFSDMIRGRDTTKVLRVMDELMETLELVAPRLYEITLNKLRETE